MPIPSNVLKNLFGGNDTETERSKRKRDSADREQNSGLSAEPQQSTQLAVKCRRANFTVQLTDHNDRTKRSDDALKRRSIERTHNS